MGNRQLNYIKFKTPPADITSHHHPAIFLSFFFAFSFFCFVSFHSKMPLHQIGSHIPTYLPDYLTVPVQYVRHTAFPPADRNPIGVEPTLRLITYGNVRTYVYAAHPAQRAECTFRRGKIVGSEGSDKGKIGILSIPSFPPFPVVLVMSLYCGVWERWDGAAFLVVLVYLQGRKV